MLMLFSKFCGERNLQKARVRGNQARPSVAETSKRPRDTGTPLKPKYLLLTSAHLTTYTTLCVRQ